MMQNQKSNCNTESYLWICFFLKPEKKIVTDEASEGSGVLPEDYPDLVQSNSRHFYQCRPNFLSTSTSSFHIDLSNRRFHFHVTHRIPKTVRSLQRKQRREERSQRLRMHQQVPASERPPANIFSTWLYHTIRDEKPSSHAQISRESNNFFFYES